MKKIASILDYSYPSLDPSVFDKDLRLYQYQKDFILRILGKMYSTYNLKSPEKWVEDVVILGSLTTSKWLRTSDMDVHIRVNLEEFKKINMPDSSKEEAYTHLDDTRKEFDRAKILLPMTQHPIEVYFENLQTNPSNIELVGVYSILKNEWLKEPVLFPADLDYEESKRNVIEQAEDLAEELDASFGKIRRDIQRVDELDQVIKAWTPDKQKLFYDKIEKKLNDIEEEIIKDLAIKQDLVDERHAKQDATSDNEILFKYLARFGFFAILSSLKDLLESTNGEVTTDELPLIEKIVSEASMPPGYWISPDGEIFDVTEQEHEGWLHDHTDFETISEALDSGWTRVIVEPSNGTVNFNVGSIKNIPSVLDDVAYSFIGKKWIVEDNDTQYVKIFNPTKKFRDEVNKALSHKTLQTASIKEAGNVLDVNGVRVFKNPSFDQVTKIFHNSKDLSLRYIIDPDTNDLFLWDAYNLHHMPVMEALGIEWTQEKYDNFTGTISSDDDIESLFIFHNEGEHQKAASLNKKAYWGAGYWITPDNKIITVREPGGKGTHSDWIRYHKKFLHDKYNINPRDMDELISEGWIRIGDFGGERGVYFIELPSVKNIPSGVDTAISQFFKPGQKLYINDSNDITLELDDPFPTLQQAVNKALRLPIKAAKNQDAKETDTQIAIDFDGTIAVDKPFPDVGEPMPGVKEALSKMKDLGYTILIYTCRSKTEEGIELVREYLDKYEIPYDSIFEGEKPFARFYIDDRAIKFTDWKDVLNQVEKSDKTASLHITSAARYWVDPNGKVYPVEHTHEDWILDNPQLLEDQYGLWKNHPEELYPEAKDNTYAIIPIMLRDGWSRVGDLFGTQRKFQGQGIEIADLENVPPSTFDFIANFGKDKYFMIEDLQKRFVELSVGDLLQDGQEVINSYLRSGNLVHASVNLPTIDPTTFNRKEPYALFIGTSNYGKAGKFDMFNVYGEHPMITPANQLPTVGLDTLIKENIPVIGKEPRAGNKEPVQDISGLYKQASLSEKYWIDPSGKEYPTFGFGHLEWVYFNILAPKKNKIEKHEVGDITNMASLKADEMLEEGWTRVTNETDDADFALEVGNMNRLPNYLDNFIASHYSGGGIEIDDLEGNYLKIDDPFPSLQKAIQRASRQPTMAKVFSKKEIVAIPRMDYQSWLVDPNGKVYKAGMNHAYWVFGHRNLLEKEYGIDFHGKFPKSFSGDVSDWFHETMKNMQSAGWTFVGLFEDGIGCNVRDVRNVPNGVFDFLSTLPLTTEEVMFEDLSGNSVMLSFDEIAFGQKAINETLQQQRLQSNKKQAQTKKVTQGDYSCLMALVPHDLAQEVVEWGVRNVPDNVLYLDEDGNLGRELESHITIKYGLLTNDAKDVRQMFNDEKPFHAKLGKVKHFQPPELPFDVLTVEVISDDLQKVNKKVCEKFECAQGLPSDEYHPHITIAYLKRDKAKEYIGAEVFEGKEIELDTIIFSPKKGNRTYFHVSKEGMSVLWKIKKSADYPAGNWGESVWISPNGEVFDLEGNSHEDAIYDLLSDDLLIISEDPNSYAINKGWTRFGEMGGGFETGLNVKNIQNIPAFVFDYLTKFTGQNKQIVIADLSGAYVHMSVDEFVLGQKAVNKALQQKRLQGSFKKKAGYDVGYWVDPSGNVYDSHSEGLVHNEWILANLSMLKKKYGLSIPNYLVREAKEYFEAMQTGEEDNFNSPASDPVWDQMLKTGWSRVGDADDGVGLEVFDIRKIPSSIDSLVEGDLHDGDWLRVDDIKHNSVAIQYPFKNIQQTVNKALSSPTKTAVLIKKAEENEYWFDPSGKAYAVPVNHDFWVRNNTALLKSQYGINTSVLDTLMAQPKWTPADSNVQDASEDIWQQMFQSGWVRIGGQNDDNIQFYIDLWDVDNIPAFVDDFIAGHFRADGWPIEVTSEVSDDNYSIDDPFPTLQKAIDKHMSTIPDYQEKAAAFLPSVVQPADNDWQFAEGGPDVEIALQPDPVSDDTTEYEPCTTGKPRTKDMWRQFMSIFRNPISKKDEMTVESYDKDLEQKEKDALGEDETLLEYSKGFYDPKKHDFPHNTTWLNTTYQDQEPSKPLPVTYSPESNEENLDQNSQDGFPWRFMRKPVGEWFSNQGEINDAVIRMLKQKEARIDSLTKDVTAIMQDYKAWLDPSGKEFHVDNTHDFWIAKNLSKLQKLGINTRGLPLFNSKVDGRDYVDEHLDIIQDIYHEMLSKGWVRVTSDEANVQFNIQVESLSSIPSFVDDFLAQMYDAQDDRTVALEDGKGTYVIVQDLFPSIQRAVNRELSHPNKISKKNITASQAGGWISPAGEELSTADHIKYLSNYPEEFGYTPEQINSLQDADNAMQASLEKGWIRWRIWGDSILIQTNSFYNSRKAENVIFQNLDNVNYIKIETEPNRDWYTADAKTFKEQKWGAFLKHGPAAVKQAGNQSASVPDYLMDEWKTEQIHDDTDSEPYVNHDQRDYPYGMHDSPENTGQNIGWAKDNSPYVVRLDQLQNPADRPFPPGLPDYEVTMFTTYPMSDGLEATNPE